MRVGTLVIMIFSAMALACGEGDSDGNAVSAPAASPASDDASSGAPAKSVQEVSAEAKQCVDLVKAGRYADALDPCERAIADGTTMEVQKAYDEAQAAVKAEASKAAAAIAADSMDGDVDKEAAKKSGLDALKNLGGDSN